MDSRLIQCMTTDFHAVSRNLKSPLWCALAFEMWRERWQ
jgi:hypothetical protein